MTEIRSKEVHVAVSAEELRSHLKDLNNLEGLLPSEKVKDFKGTEDEASFKIQGGLEIRLTRTSDYLILFPIPLQIYLPQRLWL